MAGATVLRGPMGYGASSRIPHCKDPPTFHGFASGRGNRGHRAKNQRFLADSRRDDGWRPCHSRKSTSHPLRAQEEKAMPENIWFIAAIWMGLAFLASLISIRTGISVALVEILVGVAAGNFLGIHQTTE